MFGKLFGSGGAHPREPYAQASDRATFCKELHMAKDDITAFLGSGTVYDGRLTFVGSVRIDGQFTGEIKSDGTLILGQEAKVEGSINVCHLVLSGKLNGDVVVTGKTILHKTAYLTGNLVTRSLIVEEGALLQGSVCMDPNAETGKTLPLDGAQEIVLREIDIQ
jgi:cytoskeletal protein CcmA (bactofilin family)